MGGESRENSTSWRLNRYFSGGAGSFTSNR